MSDICKYCGYVGTNDAMEKHAGEMCQENAMSEIDLEELFQVVCLTTGYCLLDGEMTGFLNELESRGYKIIKIQEPTP